MTRKNCHSFVPTAELVVLFWLLISTPTLSAQDWLSIRGPNHDGSGALGDAAIASQPLQLNVVWNRQLGSGYSGVVKSGDQLISAMADADADQEFVIAMSADSGETLWKTPTGKIMVGANGSFDGPVATPAANDTHAFHLSPFGDLAAYRLTDGAKVWSTNLKEKFGSEPSFYGFGASPIIHSGVLVVVAGAKDAAAIGFDPATGNVIWKAGSDGAAFQSPVPLTVNSKDCVLVAGNTKLFAIQTRTGDVVWSQPHGGANGADAVSAIPVPLPGGRIFLNDGRNATTLWQTENSGAAKVWSSRAIRNSYCVPVMSNGLLCSYSSRFLTAVNPETGKALWKARSPKDGFVGTIAGRLVVATLDGSLHIGDVSTDGFDEVVAAQIFNVKGGNSEGLVWSLPSIAGRSIYLRSLNSIARVDVQPGGKPAAAIADVSQLAPGFAGFIKQLESSTDKATLIRNFLNGKSMPLIEDDHVHFLLRGDYEDVAVASELFGVRQERKMIRAKGTDLFYYGIKIPEATRLSYTFFADYKPVLDPNSERKFTSSTTAGEMEPIFRSPDVPATLSWFETGDTTLADSTFADKPPANFIGTMVRQSLESKAMKQAVGLAVYLPPGYQNSTKRYPVVFVHDGEPALESGNQAAIVDQLIQNKDIRPAIVVFIKQRFFVMEGPGAYSEMFASELLPAIENDYRISQNRNDRASLSGGFGSTLTLMSTLPVSDKIGRIGCHSLFAFEMLHPAIEALAKRGSKKCEILIQRSKYDFRNPSENWNMADQAKVVGKILKGSGHVVTGEQIATGSDWPSWRTQSKRMWQFLVGQ